MNFQHVIVALLLAIVVAFGVGFQIGVSVNHQTSAIPNNLDVASALTEAKMAKDESRAYLELLKRQTDSIAELKAVCAKRDDQGISH